MLSDLILSDYQAFRPRDTNRSVLCHAPFLSLNFDQTGNVTACCYSRKFSLGTYPRDTIHEIWTGAKAREFRAAFLEQQEVPSCELCFQQLTSRNFAGALMAGFDRFSSRPGYVPAMDMPAPVVLEFEIANTCNLECVMCGGHWSSAIRAHREHLPPLRNPYDKAFVDQLEPFLPTVAQLRFLGGEPFLIRRYYDIWERLARHAPDAAVSITTNATFLPERAREVLDSLAADIVVSLDAVTASTYESIRRNAAFDEVMANVGYLLAYTRKKQRRLTFAVCPMQSNWRELDLLLRYCDNHRIAVYFNTVLHPASMSLASLPEAELGEAIGWFRSLRPAGSEWWQRHNAEQLNGLVHQLERWRAEKEQFRTERIGRNPNREESDALMIECWAHFGLGTPSFEERRAMRSYLEELLVSVAPDDARTEAPLAPSMLHGLDDLRAALAATYVFGNTRRVPTNANRLRSRLVRGERVARELPPERLTSLLLRTDFVQLVRFLDDAPDADFEKALRVDDEEVAH